MRGPFARRKDGALDVTLTQVEADLLGSVVAQMTVVLDDPPPRLYPPAYKDDPEAAAEFDRMMRSDLEEQKRRAIASVQGTLDRGKRKGDGWRVRLTADEAEDWLAVLNDARLTLGTRLAITEDLYAREVDPADADASAHEVFRYLGWIEEYLVETMMG